MARYRTVIFDCDSTLSTLEGIDVLAEGLGAERRAEVAGLTDAAMRGTVDLEEVYGKRMAIVRPSRQALEELGEEYIRTLVEDARETLAALRAEGVQVRILSGGLLPALRILARELGVPEDAVGGVDVNFDDDGEYASYDAGSPLAYAGGKRVMVERWLPELERPIMLVGDGMTDLEAEPVIDMFVAFAGVVDRPTVAAAADTVVRAPSLAPILPLALGGERPRNPEAQAVFDKAQTFEE